MDQMNILWEVYRLVRDMTEHQLWCLRLHVTYDFKPIFFCTLWWACTQPSIHTFKMSFGSSYETANCKNPLKNPEEPILNMSEAELIISLHKLGSSSRFLVCGEGTFVDTMSRMTKCENGPRLFPPPKPRSYHLIPLPPESLSYHFLLWLSLTSVASPLPTFTPATAFLLVSLGFWKAPLQIYSHNSREFFWKHSWVDFSLMMSLYRNHYGFYNEFK